MSSPAVETPRASTLSAGGQPREWEHDRAVGDQVRTLLGELPVGFVVFHDLELPKPSRSVVDHLVVGPRNLWAVTTHVSTEPVTFGSGRNADTLWSGRTPLRTVLDAADWEASTIGDLIGVAVEPIVCLVAPELPAPTFDLHGIRISEPGSLAQEVATSTIEFVDVAIVEAAVRQAFGAEPAARSAAPTLGMPVVPASHVARAPRRRRTLGARVHRLRSIRAVRVGFVMALVAAILAFLPSLIGAWNSVAREGADRLTDVIDDVNTDDARTRDTRPSAPPPTPVGYVLTCPTPGGGWMAAWVWPGPLPKGAVGYSIRTQAENAAPVLHSVLPWSDPTSPPPPARIARSSPTTVFTDHRGPDGDVVATTSATLAATTEPC